MTTLPPKQQDSRYAAVRQYSLAQILAVWAAAAIPMAVLAWVVAPLLGALLGGDEGFIKALVVCITAGLIWQFVLALILTSREQGTLRWSRVRIALHRVGGLNAPPPAGRLTAVTIVFTRETLTTRDLILRLRFSSFATSPAQPQSATLVLPGLLLPPGAGSVALPSSSV
jgi:predicted ABC-type exoprotein transport system permease subunit